MGIENSGANSITKIKHRCEGDRVTNPDRGHCNKNVKAKYNSCYSREQHLHGYRYERKKYPDGDSAGKGASIDMPETGIL